MGFAKRRPAVHSPIYGSRSAGPKSARGSAAQIKAINFFHYRQWKATVGDFKSK